MVVLDVYSLPIKNTYRSFLLSKATLFIIIVNIFNIILPFILAYRSRGLWLKHDSVYEQPNIKFSGQYVFEALTDNNSYPVVCTTFPSYYIETKSFDKCSAIKVKENDNNFDGKSDELFFEINVKELKSAHIFDLSLVIALDYVIKRNCPLHMQTALVFQKLLHTPTSNIAIRADLFLSQSGPVSCSSRYTNLDYNKSLITNLNDLESYQVQKILMEYNKRNLSTHLANVYTNQVANEQSDFTLELYVRYPVHKIYFKPGFWQILKWAWIQYFAVYVIVSWVFVKIKNYVFQNRLVLFYKQKTD